MSLKEYNKKRDFKLTKEPKGKAAIKNNSKPRFVIQYHEARAKHYDFRLEWEGVLLSWAVPKGPSMNPSDKRLAVHVEDHPLGYIDFKGIIPKGQYGAGTVEVWDKGSYQPVEDMKKGLKKGDVKIFIEGEKIKGLFKLIRTDEKNWLLIKGKDEYAKNSFDINKLKNKPIKNPFKKVDVMLAKLEIKVPSGKNWLSEIKYDGYRIVAFIENNEIKLFSRNGKDYTKKFESVLENLKLIANMHSMILDGEMVVVDEKGKSDFGALLESVKSGRSDFRYIVFDILSFDGEDLRDRPLTERKVLLKSIVSERENISLSSYVIGKSAESYKAAIKLGLEGVVCKKLDSKYSGGRNGEWVKVKCYNSQEFVIGGYTTTAKNQVLSALLLGYYEGTNFKYIGKVGTGFNEKLRSELCKQFQPLVTSTCPFEKSPKIVKGENIYFLKPKLVAQVQFAEVTDDKNLRQASFKGLRTDKLSKEVVLE